MKQTLLATVSVLLLTLAVAGCATRRSAYCCVDVEAPEVSPVASEESLNLANPAEAESSSSTSEGQSYTEGDEATELAVAPAEFQQFILQEANPAIIPELTPDPHPTPEPIPTPEGEAIDVHALSLEQVIASVQQSYPLLRAAVLEYDIAAGKQLAAEGSFDLALKTANESTPAGFYQTYRNSVKVEQPTFKGGAVYGQYRIGRGFFEPWYGERQTNDGGEVKVGFEAALLKNRHLDPRRAAIFQANLDQQAVDPAVGAQLLDFVRFASQSYWIWVASARAVEAQQELLRLATERVSQIEERVKLGDLEEIARIDNERLITSRQAKLIEAERKLQAASIKLSLYYRGAQGEPILPIATQAPAEFPAATALGEDQLGESINQALATRPELVEMKILLEKINLEVASARNKLLPELFAVVEASKDVGAPSSSKGDKTPFKLEAGLYGKVPLQRREAHGKIMAAQGKMTQVQVKRQFLIDKITAQVQDAVSAMNTAGERIDRASANLKLAQQSLELGREAFDAGDTDVIVLNIREQAVTDARLSLIAAEVDFFIAQADYRAAIGLSPH